MNKTQRRPGYLVFRPDGTFDSKVMTKPFDEKIGTEFDKITSVLSLVRPVVFAAQIAQRCLLALNSFENDLAKPASFEKLTSGRIIQFGILYKIDACRHIQNFLCAFRAFLDHCDAYTCDRYGERSEERKRFKRETGAQYDDKFAYRFCYQLRNYAQHYSMPISDATLTLLMDHGKRHYKQTSTLLIVRDELLEWSGWKKLRSELVHMPETFEVLPLVRAVGSAINEICCSVLKEKSFELIQCSEYLEKFCEILKLEPGAIPVVWIGDNAGPKLPPKSMEMIPVEELLLTVRSIGAPV